MTISDKEIEESIVKGYDNKNTVNLYLDRLRILKTNVIKDKDPSYFKILVNVFKNYEKIRLYYPNLESRKAQIVCILAVFNKNEILQDEIRKPYEQWKAFLKSLKYLIENEKSKTKIPNEKSMSKYTSFEDMELKYKELKQSNPHRTLKDSQEFILLSIVISTPPKRADYGVMKIYYGKDPNIDSENYIVIKEDMPSFLVFNKYKTSKKYKRIDQDLTIQCAEDIKRSLRVYNREYMFINRFLKPYEKLGSFSSYVRRVFGNLFGKNVGVSLLRHIFITDRLDMEDMNDVELKHIAKQMMHSNDMQRSYKWNKKDVREAYANIKSDIN